MGVNNAPNWLISAWNRTVQDTGATADAESIEEAGKRLLARWCGTERHFHNVRHLVEVLSCVDELDHEAQDPALVHLAAFYHGAVFSAKIRPSRAAECGEDETASGKLAYRELRSLGIDEARAARVRDLITAMDHHCPKPGDRDAAVLCDADLGMLARDPQDYKTYIEKIRAEYSHVSPAEFLEARKAIISKLLARPSLYYSATASEWEEAARQNLTAELHRCEKEGLALQLAEGQRRATSASPA